MKYVHSSHGTFWQETSNQWPLNSAECATNNELKLKFKIAYRFWAIFFNYFDNCDAVSCLVLQQKGLDLLQLWLTPLTDFIPIVTATEAHEVFRDIRHTKLMKEIKLTRIQETLVLWRGTVRMLLKESSEIGFNSGRTILQQPAALSTSQLYSVVPQQFRKHLFVY